MRLFSVLQIMRPANMITAVADILAGIAIAGFFIPDMWNQQIINHILLLIISTAGLYSGGIVFNDIFDVNQDRVNRPERVIPSGRLSLTEASILGSALFTIGIFSAFMVSIKSGFIAILIMIFALLYDKYSKHYSFIGPINMGICRGLNLILGMSINLSLAPDYFWIGIIPIIFIAVITLTAQKETKGKNKIAIGIAMLLDLSIILGFFIMSKELDLSLENAAIFLILWYGINVVAKFKAIVNNKPQLIQKAVKMGILSLIPLNASYTAGFSSIYMALIVMTLLPISLYLSKKFPVT